MRDARTPTVEWLVERLRTVARQFGYTGKQPSDEYTAIGQTMWEAAHMLERLAREGVGARERTWNDAVEAVRAYADDCGSAPDRALLYGLLDALLVEREPDNDLAATYLYHACAVWAGGGPILSYEELPESTRQGFCDRARDIARLSQEREPDGWRPIETAPKDGTVILAWRFYPCAVRWTGGGEEYPWEAVHLGGYSTLHENAFCAGDPHLTHWMPLPPAPEPQEGS